MTELMESYNKSVEVYISSFSDLIRSIDDLKSVLNKKLKQIREQL